MNYTSLIITSIAGDDNAVLRKYSEDAKARKIHFIVVGDNKSPADFSIDGCDYYSMKRQMSLKYNLAEILPGNHYSRKNIGYLVAMSNGADRIIETDDDNLPLPGFWDERSKNVTAHHITDSGWVNIYRYFTDKNIWPRGFSLEHIDKNLPGINGLSTVECPVHQGLADGNPDVDAIYRLILPLPLNFNKAENIALGKNTVCPFNSQNTTWFRDAFMLMYLPSYCSFRMTDIWRSFVAQRVLWTCGWSVMFHNSTVYQERNEHNLMKDFSDEIPGYSNNTMICQLLQELNLPEGPGRIAENMMLCYSKLTEKGFIGTGELRLLDAWLKDAAAILNN
jgi:hypothetical protein